MYYIVLWYCVFTVFYDSLLAVGECLENVDFAAGFFFFKQKTAYEMRISDWSSDVCSSDLHWHFTLPIMRWTTYSGSKGSEKRRASLMLICRPDQSPLHILNEKLSADTARVVLRPFHLAWASNVPAPSRAAQLVADSVDQLGRDSCRESGGQCGKISGC